MVINGIPNCRLVIMKYGVILPGYWGAWTNPYERAAYQPASIMRWDTGNFNGSNGWFICIETWLVKIPNVLFGDVTCLLSKWSPPPKKKLKWTKLVGSSGVGNWVLISGFWGCYFQTNSMWWSVTPDQICRTSSHRTIKQHVGGESNLPSGKLT